MLTLPSELLTSCLWRLICQFHPQIINNFISKLKNTYMYTSSPGSRVQGQGWSWARRVRSFASCACSRVLRARIASSQLCFSCSALRSELIWFWIFLLFKFCRNVSTCCLSSCTCVPLIAGMLSVPAMTSFIVWVVFVIFLLIMVKFPIAACSLCSKSAT